MEAEQQIHFLPILIFLKRSLTLRNNLKARTLQIISHLIWAQQEVVFITLILDNAILIVINKQQKEQTM